MILKDSSTEYFQKCLPCNNCKFSEVCKFKDNVNLVEIPSYFEISVTCKYEQHLSKLKIVE